MSTVWFVLARLGRDRSALIGLALAVTLRRGSYAVGSLGVDDLPIVVLLGLGTAAALGVVVSIVTARFLLDEKEEQHAPQQTGKRKVPRRIWVTAGLAGMVMLSEGAANDWSVLHLQDVLGASPEIAAFGYGAFATTMTVGRLLADRVNSPLDWLANEHVVAYGAASRVKQPQLGEVPLPMLPGLGHWHAPAPALGEHTAQVLAEIG